MELEFQKSTCKYLDRVLREARNQEQTQEIRLSDGMPDIGRVLASWGQVILRSKEWRSDAVAFSGGIMVWILYAPEDGTDPRCVESWIPFQMDWDIQPGTREGDIRIQPLLRFVDARSVSARKLMVRVGVAALGEAFVSGDAGIPVLDELEEDIQLLKNSYPIRLIREAGEKTFQLDEELALPGSSPMPEKLLMYTVNPQVTEKRISGKRLIFKGNGNLHILYRDEDGQLRSWDFELPFSQLANLEDSHEEDPLADMILCTTALELDLDDEGHLRLKCGLLGQYTVSDRQMVSVIEDAYSPSREVMPVTESMELPAILDSRQENIYGEQTIPQDASRIVDVEFLPDFPRQRRAGESVELELPGQFQLLYYGEDGALQSASPRWEGTYRMTADENSRVNATVLPGERGQVLLENGQIRLKPEITLGLETQAQQGIPMVTGLELGQMRTADPGRPSLILRRAGNGGLWRIAKDVGTTVSAIQEANGLAGEPLENQILLIPVS